VRRRGEEGGRGRWGGVREGETGRGKGRGKMDMSRGNANER